MNGQKDKIIKNLYYPPLKNGDVFYFKFEEDFFTEENVRCIPMIVRFKLDACGIKLKLKEWSKMRFEERKKLAEFICVTEEDIKRYRKYLQQIVFKRTGNEATDLPIEKNEAWSNGNQIPPVLVEKLKEFNRAISLHQWQELTNLQRFVLIKLSRPGHEHKNFPKAYKEFGLVL